MTPWLSATAPLRTVIWSKPERWPPTFPLGIKLPPARASNVVRTGEILQPDATAWSPRLENVGVSSTADELNTCRTSALFLLQLPRS